MVWGSMSGSHSMCCTLLKRDLDKEQWEPTLEKLFTLHSERSQFPQIREAWALDWQSHGESAVLNEESLKDDPASARAFLSEDKIICRSSH
jgi:hypothetical protein